MITAKEIAALAGVSRGTVDRALHGRSGINPDVAARILRIAEQHGYAPDRAGRALSSRKNPPNIGVVFHAGDNPFFDAVIDGMRRAQSEYKDFRMELHLRETGGYDAEKQLRHMRELESAGVQAMIITPVNVPSVAAEIDRLHQRGIPTVCVNSDIDSCLRAAYVGCDYHQSGAVAAGLAGLMASAHMEAGVVIGSLKILGHAQRVSGFNSELKKTGCVTVVGVVENGDDDARSRAAVVNLLRAHRPGLLYFAAGCLRWKRFAPQTALPVP